MSQPLSLRDIPFQENTGPSLRSDRASPLPRCLRHLADADAAALKRPLSYEKAAAYPYAPATRVQHPLG